MPDRRPPLYPWLVGGPLAGKRVDELPSERAGRIRRYMLPANEELEEEITPESSFNYNVVLYEQGPYRFGFSDGVSIIFDVLALAAGSAQERDRLVVEDVLRRAGVTYNRAMPADIPHTFNTVTITNEEPPHA